MGYRELHTGAESSRAWALRGPSGADELFPAPVPDSGLRYLRRKRNLFADIKMPPLT